MDYRAEEGTELLIDTYLHKHKASLKDRAELDGIVALMDIFQKFMNSKFGHACLWQLAAWIDIYLTSRSMCKIGFLLTVKFHNSHASWRGVCHMLPLASTMRTGS